METNWSTIRLESRPPLAELILDRPEMRNALSTRMMEEIGEALDQVEADTDLKVLIIRGEGDAFCAGADLGELKAIQGAEFEENMAASLALVGLFRRIYTFPKATIAAVHGPCVAGGCGIATGCDLIIADESARFRYSEAAIGFVAAIVSIFLLRIVGEKHARELLLTARFTPAAEALRIGLVNEVVGSGEHLERAREVAREIALNSGISVRLSKEVLERLPSLTLDEAFEYVADVNARGRLNEECREGIAAFLEKRTPAWRLKVEEQLAAEEADRGK
jgi:methylglutaconyl-CoA hydratase